MKTEEIIEQITEVLIECDSDFIEHIANQVLGRKVRYIENDLWEYKES